MKANVMKLSMLACCAMMALPIGIYVAAGGTPSDAIGNLAIFAPLLLCTGAHFLMFKLMGKSCHGARTQKSIAPVPVIERSTVIPAIGTRVGVAVQN